MWNQASAIVWAQWRSTLNYFPRSNPLSLIFTALMSTAWYGGFAALACIAAYILSNPDEMDFIQTILPTALLLAFLYWQVIPILMASMGSSLDIRKLLVYPIPSGALFSLEVLLRASTGIEVLLVLAGAAIGLLINPKIPGWAPLALVVFAGFNLLFSAGVRDLMVRLLARKRIREIVVFLFVIAAALPQLLVVSGSEHRLERLFSGQPWAFWPWTATASLAAGDFSWKTVAILLGWIAGAYVFGRWQFERGLRFDVSEAAARSAPNGRRASRLEWFYQLPNAIFRDPLAALIEKELRFLSRAPRFRLVFLMGFSFGLLIWVPMAFGRRASGGHSWIADHYLTFVSVYALLLLSDALFWNCFGFDRSAAQMYFLAPFPVSRVLIAKNLTAVFFVLLEVGLIALVCALLRLPVHALELLEALTVTLVVTAVLLSIGNLSSLYNPRAVNPSKSFRTAASGRMQAFLMLAFPVALTPVALAYLARYAFQTEWAFFGVLVLGGALAGVAYAFSMESAVQIAERRKEQIITTLGSGEGPIQS